MKRSRRAAIWAAAGICAALCGLADRPSTATEVLLKDGRVLRGRTGETAGLAEQSGPGDGNTLKQIVFVNDDFRLIFVSRRQIQAVKPDTSLDDAEKFECKQPRGQIGRNGRQKVVAVGPPAGPMKDFDPWGRRTYPMRTAGGILNVVQVITDLTPQYAKVEALKQTWDMRIATSTISDETLDKILQNQIDPKNLDHRKKLVRFYLQCKRYGMAVTALHAILKDFKDDTTVAQDLQPTLQKLHIMYAQQMLEELGLRRDCGQHALVKELLKKFPTENVTGEILQTVRQAQQLYESLEAQRLAVRRDCQDLFLKVEAQADRAALVPILDEIWPEMTAETLPRMASFVQNQNDPQLKPEEKLALAASGWLLGADAATSNVEATASIWRLRGKVRQFLAEPKKVSRDQQIDSILKEGAARPETLAALAAQMKPPLELPEPADAKIPGLYKLTVAVLPGQPDVTYHVQLPPEYNPQRRYPAVVSLHNLGHDPDMQISWWAGDPQEDGTHRRGQAGRFGYIVIAPAWTVEHQKECEYSPREHAAVLGCLRDACQRFAIDTDRVFLSGHSAGGDAAWDIGVSHPDLWAGVIPISAEARKSCVFYTENARLLPFYLVLGELDGGRITRNALVLDRYLRNGFNTTVVEYLGRGHEHFVDEQLPIFDWMNRCKRSFPVPREREMMHEREFACATMRACDNRFWWAEIDGLPPNAQVTAWPAPRGTQPLLVRGNVTANNGVQLTAGNTRATIWLSPDMVNFNARINLTVGGRRPNGVPAMIKPSVETMLEDLRVRGDRQHPFWAKVEAR